MNVDEIPDCNLPILEDTYELLLEESKDITYRMYDLFFQKHPELVSNFPCAREKHPTIILYLLCKFVQRTEGRSKLPIDCRSIPSDGEWLQFIKSEHLPWLKECLFDAIKDILFDDATPAMLKAWSHAYDCLTGDPSKKNVVQIDARRATHFSLLDSLPFCIDCNKTLFH